MITEPENPQALLKEFLEQNIRPLQDEERRMRQHFHNRFWLYFGVLFFVNSANVLIALFRYLVYGSPLSGSLLGLIAVFSVLFLWWYAKKQNKKPLPNILETFLTFYGNWTLESAPITASTLNEPFLPAAPFVSQPEIITGSGVKNLFVLRHLQFWNKNPLRRKKLHKTDEGLWLRLTLPYKADGTLMLFEKGGFFKQKKFESLEKINVSGIAIANYFQIFTDSAMIKNYVVGATLLENLLDMKEIFKAGKIYMQLKDNTVDLYMQGGQLSYRAGSWWIPSSNMDALKNLHKQFDKIFTLESVITALEESSGAYV